MSTIKGLLKDWVLPPRICDSLFKLLNRNKVKRTTSLERKLLQDTLALKDRHRGERCFIVGSGPSIKQQDLSLLDGECVLTVNNAFVHPAFIRSKPKYHVTSPIISHHGDCQSIESYVGWLKDMEEKTASAEMFFHIGDHSLIEDHQLFLGRKIHWVEHLHSWDENDKSPIDLREIPPIWSVSETAITVALYLGFEKIYLLGFDHDWFNGLFSYFYDYKTEHKDLPEDFSVPQVDSEYQMRRHATMFKKYKYLYSLKKNIYNANADMNSYVDVFPKVEYDGLFTGLGKA